MKHLGAEFIGTFWLVLGGCGSAIIAAAEFRTPVSDYSECPLRSV